MNDLVIKFKEVFAGMKFGSHLNTGEYPAYFQAYDKNENFHYELIQRESGGDIFLEFHVERAHYWEYENEVNLLCEALNQHGRDIAHTTRYSTQIWRCRRPIENPKDLLCDAKLLKEVIGQVLSHNVMGGVANCECSSQVGIAQISMLDVIKWNLKMPPVQREYCWDTDNIRRMFDNLQDWRRNHDGLKYHMGCVILREKESCESNCYEIFDGQQRLTTFALWLNAARGECVSLLNEKETLVSSRSRKFLLAVWKELKERPREDLLRWAEQCVDVSIVKIVRDAPADLPFRFFNHVNSSGVRLTDYELLKSHHLRFVGGDVSQEAARRWHELELATDGTLPLTDVLLHQILYRLRMWTIGERGAFPFDAANTEERLLFQHFRATVATPSGIMAFPRPMEFDSLVTGGMAFFDFVSRQRTAFEAFSSEPAIKVLDACLSWHSRGVLWSGIRALSFLFYLRFGTAYLGKAIGLISCHVSEIRNETRVTGAHLSKRTKFREVCDLLRRATDEGQFFAALESIRTDYKRDQSGRTKANYWSSLEKLQKELENV